MQNHLVQALIDEVISGANARKLLVRAIPHVAGVCNLGLPFEAVTSREQFMLLSAMAGSAAEERRNIVQALAEAIMALPSPDIHIGGGVRIVSGKIVAHCRGSETREEELTPLSLERVLRFAVLVHYNDKQGQEL